MESIDDNFLPQVINRLIWETLYWSLKGRAGQGYEGHSALSEVIMK